MEAAVHRLFAEGLASSTRATYSSAQLRYLNFCSQLGASPLPLTERTLCLFAAFLVNEGLRAQSISVYLSAVCHLQVSSGLPAPSRSTWPWLQYVIRGTQGPSARVRLPITASILTQLLEVWSTQLSSGDGYAARLLWATSCLAFFGFFRLAELLPDSPSSPAPLLLSDIAVDSRSSPSMICLHIRRAKNDPFGKGAKVYLGKTNMAVTATLNYIVVRPDAPGPLLLWKLLFLSCAPFKLSRQPFSQLALTTPFTLDTASG